MYNAKINMRLALSINIARLIKVKSKVNVQQADLSREY